MKARCFLKVRTVCCFSQNKSLRLSFWELGTKLSVRLLNGLCRFEMLSPVVCKLFFFPSHKC